MKIACPLYPTQQGLGVLAKSFVDHGVISHPYAVLHTSHPNLHAEWYPDAPSGSIREPHRILSWISSIRREIDAVLCFETPFALDLFPLCKRLGIRTVLVPMYECFHAGQAAHPPDLYLCPSTLDLKHFLNRHPTAHDKGIAPAVHIPVPVEVPWRLRERVHTFVHNAGHGSFQDRNGTQLLLEAWPLVKSAARLILRSQGAPNALMNLVKSTRNVDVRIGSAPYESLWNEGDAFVFVERWNGLSLPLQEARASGMLVIAGDRAPMNEWLPRTIPTPEVFDGTPLSRDIPVLVKPSGYEATRIGPPYPTVEAAQYDPKDVAAMIDRWYDTDISTYSLSGREWAGEMIWEKLKPRWLEAIAG